MFSPMREVTVLEDRISMVSSVSSSSAVTAVTAVHTQDRVQQAKTAEQKPDTVAISSEGRAKAASDGRDSDGDRA